MRTRPRITTWSLGVVSALLFILDAGVRPARIAASDPGGSGDWPMWGGTPDRNMVSNMKGLPAEWDVKTKRNVKWIAELGSESYGNPTVAGGIVFVGTNNEGLRDPKQPGDRGVLMICDPRLISKPYGKRIWQRLPPFKRTRDTAEVVEFFRNLPAKGA